MADVAADLKTWFTTASSNSPAGGTAVGTGLDDNLRELQKVVRQDLAHKGSDITSATTTDLGAVAGLMHDITGTTTITGFGTVSAGIWKIIKFEDALTLTHNSTSLILPGGANITTANGDIAIVMSEGSGNWRCVTYVKAASIAATLTGSETLTNKTLTAPALNGALSGDAIAAQAEMETGTATDSIVSPGRQHFHPSAVKAWCQADAAGTINGSYNTASVTDTGAGDITFNWATDFSGTTYFAVVQGQADPGGVLYSTHQLSTSFAAGATRGQFVRSDFVVIDPTLWMGAALGDHA